MIWTINAYKSSHTEASSPEISVKFEVDGENEVCVHVSPHGRGDHHVLPRLQAVKLSHFPLIVEHLTILHSLVVLEENTLQMTFRCLKMTGFLFSVMCLLPEHH